MSAVNCWAGPSSAFELSLQQPQGNYALEQLRQRLMYAVVSPFDSVKAARVIMQMAFETEIGTAIKKMVTPPPSLLKTVVCERQLFIDVDASMQLNSFLVGPAFDALEGIPNMQAPYADLLRRFAASDYPRYRTCALAAVLCLATYLENL